MSKMIPTLTLHQPWSSLVAGEKKQWETRSRRWKYTGPLAIHAAANDRAGKDFWWKQPFHDHLRDLGWVAWRFLPFGKVLAVVRLVECRPTEEVVKEISDLEQAFGDYRPGRWAYRLEMVYKFPQPIPARGFQGLWRWELPAEYYPVIRPAGIMS